MPRPSSTSYGFFHERVTLGVLFALTLTGCQGPSAPGGSPTAPPPTASPTPAGAVSPASATPSTAATYKPADAKGKAQNVPVPVMPELAKENSKAGLEAFIRYWYATYSYALETGNLTQWLKCTNPAAAVASAHKDAVESNYTNGRWLVGGRLSTPVIEVNWTDGDNEPQPTKVQVIQEAIQYFDAEGTKGQGDSPATNTAEAVLVKYESGAWQVTDYGTIVC